MEIKGIDVSVHNGIIDWEKVKAGGIKFAILRTGYGVENPNQIDKQFERNYAACKRVNMPVGAYHYSYAKSVEAARNEARFMLKLLAGKKFEYPIYFDIEDEKLKPLGKTLLTNIVIAFCSEIEKSGYYAAVYSNPDWLVNRLDVAQISRFDLWLAEWTNLKKYRGEHGMWQYSDKGTVPGISGAVDLDVAYKDYPAIIKKAGLNGYKKNPTYAITAVQKGLTQAKAEETAAYLKKLGMTAEIKEE